MTASRMPRVYHHGHAGDSPVHWRSLVQNRRKSTILHARSPTNERKPLSRLNPTLQPALSPSDLVPDSFSHEGGHLPLPGVASERRLRKDELVVERDLEPTLRRGEELDVLDQRRPATQQLVRQTDGAGNVVSGNAELDRQAMAGVEDHAPTLPRCRGYGRGSVRLCAEASRP